MLYGFDPWPGLIEGESELDGTRVVLERKAAWIEDGVIEYARVRHPVVKFDIEGAEFPILERMVKDGRMLLFPNS